MFPRYNEKRDSFGTVTVTPGERHTAKVPLGVSDVSALKYYQHAEHGGTNMSTTQVACFGFIRYLDDLDISRWDSASAMTLEI